MMEQRKFTGEPIDITWQPGPWARGNGENEPDDDTTDMSTNTDTQNGGESNGETVAGTSPDDFGDEQTVVLPETADPDNMTPAHREAVEAAVLMQNADQKDIASAIGRHRSTVSHALKQHYPHHPSRQSNKGDNLQQRDERTCDGCGKTFGSVGAFGGHLSNGGVCPDTDDETAAGDAVAEPDTAQAALDTAVAEAEQVREYVHEATEQASVGAGAEADAEPEPAAPEPEPETSGDRDPAVDEVIVTIRSMHRQAKREFELSGSSEAAARQATLEEVINVFKGGSDE